MRRKQKRSHRVGRGRIALIALAITIASVLSTVAYAISYSESTDALGRVSVYCASYEKIPHVFTPDSHQTAFTHYVARFGVNNTSSSDVDANWKVGTTNQTWPDYTTVGDSRSFTIPHRGATRALFNIYINQENMTIHSWELTVSESYSISLFNFESSFVPSASLPSCE